MPAHEILTVAEMTAADQAAIAAGTPGTELMERAGTAVAEAIAARFSPRRTVVLCGPGNNGGDGYVTARVLARMGWDVAVQAAAPPKSPDAVAAAGRWTGPVGLLNAGAADYDLVVDAIFGAGLDRPLTAEIQRLARASERWSHKVVAIDTPSGLSGDTARKLGEECFRAALTVTFHRRKPAHALQPGLEYCGEVVVADIGLGQTPTQLWENTPDLWLARFPWPEVNAHKHARGRLIVVSGEAWNTGAARLAARSGLRAGAGLVTLLSPPEAAAVNAAHLEAV
ncbi:MAG: NAD(P)H-hydrate epimerase, partial [Proteobacteria bacterium]|nr:NAD(P)H-hydrate epimerase [Pseudomonadota bacterium]